MKLEDLLYLAALGAIIYAALRAKSSNCYQECMRIVGNPNYCAESCQGSRP